jgi:hypothetical protein
MALKIKDIYFGSTDAKNELLHNSEDEKTRFLSSFVQPPTLDVEKFFKRDKYFVVGLKGTGKTALLRYISLKLERAYGSTSHFVLFKSEIDESIKKDFSKASRVQFVEENVNSYDSDDYESVWRWFIYRKIASIIVDDKSIDQKNENLSPFLEIVGSELEHKLQRDGIMRLVPSIRKGNIEISKAPKIELFFDWDSKDTARVDFNSVVRRADEFFKNIPILNKRIDIFFDELELNFSSSKQYQRDARLIRDLVISIEKVNATCKAKGYNICIFAALRSEVLNIVDAIGKEINKPIYDFGSSILWNRAGLDATQQPLLNIICQKINMSREIHGFEKIPNSKIWSDYFPDRIHGRAPQIYILHNSWYRPRDIVRLLLSVQEQYPEETSFLLQGIEAVRKGYSTASWVELTEELKAKYRQDDINGIKYILYGYKSSSSLIEISRRAMEKSEEYKETRSLLEKYDIKDVLIDLYRIGVVGNHDRENDRMRFSFRGDDEILFDRNIFVHIALRAHLSIFS